MEKKVFKEENYKFSKWSGGETTEFAILPEMADYLDRDFIWRLSSADSELEESSFTKLPGFDRILMLIQGQVVLAHGDERTVNLNAGEQDSFDGALKTKCFGKLDKDYNLIMVKGSRGRMEIKELTSDAKSVELTERDKSDNEAGQECASYGIYSVDGYAVVSVNGDTSMVNQNQQMVINCQPGEVPDISLMGEGKCIFTEVIFRKQQSVFDNDKMYEVHGSDFLIAMKLFLGNNRWSKLFRRERKKGYWYSPELVKKLDSFDKFFITGIVWIIGVLACLGTLALGLKPEMVGMLVIAYTVIDMFLISPLIYMIALPKPLSKHIRKPVNLNAYEQKLYEEYITRDVHQEKLMHKYRNISGEKFDGMGDFIRKLNK